MAWNNKRTVQSSYLHRSIKGMDGTLSSEEFKSSCAHMIDAWSTYCPHLPQWQWRDSGSYSLTGEGYLVLEDWPFQHIHDTTEIKTGACNDVDGGMDGATDIATVHPPDCETHFYTYHIVYNDMYRVPKLFLKGRYHDGQPLNWQDILQILPAGLSNDSAKWTFLTYEEHPYLHMPWLALHPCGTSELMRQVFSTSTPRAKSGSQNDSEGYACVNQNASQASPLLSVNFYNLTWLSFVSQAVAFKLPKEFSQCFLST